MVRINDEMLGQLNCHNKAVKYRLYGLIPSSGYINFVESMNFVVGVDE